MPLGDFLIRAKDDEDPEADAAPRPVEHRSGGLFGDLQLSGVRGDAGSRVGRGVARVMDDALAEMPLALRILQPFHATIPLGDWDYANAEFFITGDHLVFEEILFESSLDGMFLQRTARAEGAVLDRNEQAVVDAVDKPLVPVSQAVATSLQERAMRRLVSRAILRLAAFTPTDASHVLGDQTTHDPEIAGRAGRRVRCRGSVRS